MRRRVLVGAAILTIQVPRYERQEQTGALRTPRAQGVGPEAFGGGLAQGLNRLGAEMEKANAEEVAKANRTAVLTSRAALDSKEQELTWGTEELPGFLRKGGKEVFAIDAPTLEDFDTFVAETEGRLQEGEQRQAFRALADQRRNAINLNLQRHISGEVKKYSKEANQAALASTANNVAQFWNDPARVEQEMRFGFGIIESDPENASLPRAVVDQRREAWESGIHRTVIEKMMMENPSQAQAYLEDVRSGEAPGILPADAAAVEKQLKPLAEAQQASESATLIFSANPDASLLEMLEQAREKHKDEPGVSKAAQAEIRATYLAREEEIKQATSEAENTIYATIAKIKMEGRVPRRGDVPRSDWARLADLDAKAVDRIVDELNRGQEHAADRSRTAAERSDNKPSQDQLTTWGLLKTNPTALKATNLDTLLTNGKIAPSLYKDLITDQRAMLNDKGEKETQLLTNKTAVDIVLKGAGISQNKHPEKYAQFYEALSARLHGMEKPNQEQVTAAARGLLTEVSQDRDWWPLDRDVPAFAADPNKVRVPAADRAAIVAVLQKRNLPVTDEAINNLYLDLKKRGK